MLDRVKREDGGLEGVRAQVEQATGTVLFLGSDQQIIAALAAKEEVTRLFVATTNDEAIASVKRSLPRPLALKVEHVQRSPFRVQRRDIDGEGVDYLLADLWENKWAASRIDDLRVVSREFRPRRMGYRWQELDIAAEWLAKGYDFDRIDASAVDIFRIETTLMVEPRTNEYAKSCAVLAQQNMGRSQ